MDAAIRRLEGQIAGVGDLERLDQLLYRRGFFPSRERARRAVMAGIVEVDGRRIDKPGRPVAAGADLRVVATAEPFVSRGGRKLAAALDRFAVDPTGLVCLDIGASTGGFTDCLLQRGASRVYALDVGYGQLDYGLRRDPRVVVMERVNVRYLGPDDLPEAARLATFDVSFISLTKVVPAVLPHLEPGADLLLLIKPQFEADRGQVGKGGIVRDADARAAIVSQRITELAAFDLSIEGSMESPVAGAKGNRETFAWLRTKRR